MLRASKFATLQYSFSRLGTEDDLQGSDGALAPRYRIKSESEPESKAPALNDYGAQNDSLEEEPEDSGDGSRPPQSSSSSTDKTNKFHYGSPSKGPTKGEAKPAPEKAEKGRGALPLKRVAGPQMWEHVDQGTFIVGAARAHQVSRWNR